MEQKTGKLRHDAFFVISAAVCVLCILLLAGILAILMFRDKLDGDTAASGAEASQPSAMQQAVPTDVRPIVVVDAGHGGADGGAVGVGGAVEAEITAVVAEKVLQLLAAHGDELVAVPAHQFGTDATAMDRANTAAQLDADLLVSLHLNADASVYTNGFQVFPAPPGRLHHEESLRFAHLLLEEVEATGVTILGTNGVYYCYYPKIPGGYSKELVDAAWVDEDDPPLHESFGVVDYPGCPAALVEMWHVSGGQDMAAFNNDAGHDAMAQSVYRAICRYFGLLPLL